VWKPSAVFLNEVAQTQEFPSGRSGRIAGSIGAGSHARDTGRCDQERVGRGLRPSATRPACLSRGEHRKEGQDQRIVGDQAKTSSEGGSLGPRHFSFSRFRSRHCRARFALRSVAHDSLVLGDQYFPIQFWISCLRAHGSPPPMALARNLEK
jgi:hypothetical protein